MSSETAQTTAAEGRGSEAAARELLGVVEKLVRESQARAETSVTLDSDLERDLGLDSLGRSELLDRLDHAFEVSLPEQALLAETPRELLQEVRQAGGKSQTPAPQTRYEEPEEAESAPESAATLLEVLDWHVQAHPDRTHLHVYGDADQAEDLSYADLARGAGGVALLLKDKGLEPGQTAAIMLPTGREYFLSFFGILAAGAVPVPIYPPARPNQLEEHLRRHAGILNNARVAILITVDEAKGVARLLQSQVKTLRHLVTADEIGKSADSAKETTLASLDSDDIAFLQYTSGTTGQPKGVVLTHANLLANLRAMGERIDAGSTDVFVSWLPLYHDMGLIGAWFGSLYYACPLVVMSPLTFLARPLRWLSAIHRHRGTLSAAPNFGYELCLRKIDDEDLEDLDLGTWRMAFNGAESISPETVVRFGDRLKRCGFRPEAMTPVYGLAEGSLGLTFPPPGRGPVIDRVKRNAFSRSGKAEPADEDDSNALRFVGCGEPLPDHPVRIVDDNDRELPQRREGRLQFQGPSCTREYYRNREATDELFHGDWLDSGDRAYIAEGEVYITGRSKDLIIRGGRNLYPQELEDAVGEIEGIRKGCVAVFGSTDEDTRTERLVVAAETHERDDKTLERLRKLVSETCQDRIALPPDDIALVPPHSVLKTSSGKIRRAATRELYQRGALGRGPRAPWRQFLRVSLASAPAAGRRLLKRAGDNVYAGYAWVCFGIMAPVLWGAIVALPRPAWRWGTARAGLRLLARLTGLRPEVEGLHKLPSESCVLVANHASYLDSLILTAAIPRNFSYVAKRELAERFFPRLLLSRLGTVFIERSDRVRSAHEAEQVERAAGSGRSLAFFPEGTFTRAPGLRPFRMGAFVTGAEAQIPVVPAAIRGTRSVLRAGSWRPHRHAIEVTIETPITPRGDGWQAAVRLRDAARKAILRHCGEPDLAGERSTH